MILLNKAQCKICDDIIISTHRHDYVSCKCGAIFTDGGNDYIRRGAKDLNDIIDLSVFADAPEDFVRKYSNQILQGGQEIYMHNPETCLGDSCPAHKPSNHHMVEWPLTWSQQDGFMRTCEHGQMHVDPDSLQYGHCFGDKCDGCCVKENISVSNI